MVGHEGAGEVGGGQRTGEVEPQVTDEPSEGIPPKDSKREAEDELGQQAVFARRRRVRGRLAREGRGDERDILGAGHEGREQRHEHKRY